MKIRIGKIDMDGFLGRGLHPNKEHEGLEALVISSSSELYSDDLQCVANFSELKPFEIATIMDSDPESILVSFFLVRLPNGKFVEVMEHEIAEILK